MGCLRYPRKQTPASAAAMTDPDPDPFADCDYITCYGGGQADRPASILQKDRISRIHRIDKKP
jgi:hypothetical protein